MKLQQNRKRWNTKNRSLRMLLILCMVLCIIPVTAQKTSRPTLYKVFKATDQCFGTPYRAAINGDIIGELPNDQVYEVTGIEGDWAKVKYRGGEYYVLKDRLEKVDAPDIVCSPWAKEWLSYTGAYIGTAGEWSGAADDWTKPITRADMADTLVDIMYGVYGSWEVSQTLPTVIKRTGNLPLTDTQDFEANRLAYWAVIPAGKFDPTGSITYNEVTSLVIKLMAYEQRYIREGGGETFTKAHIDGFGIGGSKGPNAKCTKEQIKILCDKVLCWREEMQLRTSAKYEESDAYSGTANVYNGIYTIRTLLGEKPDQPHLFIDAEGKVELNSAKKQQFKITFKKSALNKDRKVMFLYTIQAMDGKYLGMPGTPVNGSRLAAQKTAFLWWIEMGSSEDGQNTTFIEDPNNYHQVLNVSGWNTADGTPVITSYWKHGTGADSNNCKFIFSKVK